MTANAWKNNDVEKISSWEFDEFLKAIGKVFEEHTKRAADFNRDLSRNEAHRILWRKLKAHQEPSAVRPESEVSP